jgi:hypothetical protein
LIPAGGKSSLIKLQMTVLSGKKKQIELQLTFPSRRQELKPVVANQHADDMNRVSGCVGQQSDRGMLYPEPNSMNIM